MKAQSILFAATALCALTPMGQGQSRLLYTPLLDATSNQCPKPALSEVLRNEVQFVGPSKVSKAFATVPNYNTLVGDHDGDGDYNEPEMFSRIDALLQPWDLHGNPIPATMRQLFFSPKEITAHAALGWAFDPGDVGRIVPCDPAAGAVDGTLERFVEGFQIGLAFGLHTSEDLDAITYDPDPEYGGIFLSFESAQSVICANFVGTVGDGAILRIPNHVINWIPSCYDGARLVSNIQPYQGQVAFTEPHVNALVAAAGILDCGGAPVSKVSDTNGLEVDPDLGLVQTPTGLLIHHLWFSGARLENATVLTTAGTVAELGLNPLNSIDTVGLVDPCGTTMDGLALQKNICRFTTDALSVPLALGGTAATVEVGGAPDLTFLLWSFESGAPVVDATVPFPNPCFREFYPNFLLIDPVSIGALHCGELTRLFPPAAGWRAIVQAAGFDGATWRLSTPSVIDLQ